MARLFPANPASPRSESASRFCPHVTLLAILTPTLWIALIYLLFVR